LLLLLLFIVFVTASNDGAPIISIVAITANECCFNHIIGLPTKEGLEKPIFDYQELLYEALLSPDFCNPLNHGFKDKHLGIKKATGLGVTEFFLRFMEMKKNQLYLRTNKRLHKILSYQTSILNTLFHL